MEQAPAVKPPPAPPYWGVAWDWTDVLLVVAGVAVAIIGGAILFLIALAAFQSSPHTLAVAVASTVADVGIYLLIGAAIVLVVAGRRHQRLSALGWRMPRNLRQWPGWTWLLLAVVAAVVAIAVATGLAVLNAGLFPQQSNTQCADVQLEFGPYIGLAIPVVCIVVPIVEESLFRGFLYGWMRKRLTVWPALLLISAVFAISHMVLVLLIPLFFVGMVLAWLYENSRSLIPGAMVHSLFNLYGIIGILSAGTSC